MHICLGCMLLCASRDGQHAMPGSGLLPVSTGSAARGSARSGEPASDAVGHTLRLMHRTRLCVARLAGEMPVTTKSVACHSPREGIEARCEPMLSSPRAEPSSVVFHIPGAVTKLKRNRLELTAPATGPVHSEPVSEAS